MEINDRERSNRTNPCCLMCFAGRRPGRDSLRSASQTTITYDPTGRREDDGKGREALLAVLLIFLPDLPSVLSLYSVFRPSLSSPFSRLLVLLLLHLLALRRAIATHRDLDLDTMDMSSESSARTWYETPRSLEPPSGGAGVAGVVGNDYRGYYPHAGPTAHHPAAAAHYAHSKYTHRSLLLIAHTFFLSLSLCASFSLSLSWIFSFFSLFFLPEKLSSRFNDWPLADSFF